MNDNKIVMRDSEVKKLIERIVLSIDHHEREDEKMAALCAVLSSQIQDMDFLTNQAAFIAKIFCKDFLDKVINKTKKSKKEGE